MTNGGNNTQGETWLWRMVALLLSLATLADRVGNYPAPVRWIVLRAMRRAERIARLFIIGLAADCGFSADLPAPILSRSCGSRTDAAALANAFEILAETLDELLPHADALPPFPAQPAGRWPSARAARFAQTSKAFASAAAPYPDTS